MSTGAEKSSTSAHSRSAKPDERDYTPAQVTAVNRVRKCKVSDYYAILDIESPSSEAEIRKAYRKLALIMHPDKNSAPGADEAFKMVSKAFQILSDPDKKRIFDQTGTDPDNRTAGPSFSRARAGGGAGAGPGGHPFAQFEGDISPEDLFNMFFGGGGGGFGGGGAQFGFGGPGVRIHSFGGGSPFAAFGGPNMGQARRQQQQQQQRQRRRQDQEEEVFSLHNLVQLLPLFLLFGIPLLFNLFMGDSSDGATPRFLFEPKSPYTLQRATSNHHIPYFVNPREVTDMTDRKLNNLDRQAEVIYVRKMRDQCAREYEYKQEKLADAKGWFFVDQEAYDRAVKIPLNSCEKLDDLGIAYNR